MYEKHIGNKFYINKTLRFLVHVLYEKDINFLNYYNNLFKFAVGVYDWKRKLKFENNLYIMFNLKFNISTLNKFLKFIRNQKYYVDDYKISEKALILVVKVNESVFYNFVEGNYSNMYSDNLIENLYFKKNDKSILKGVGNNLLKNELKSFFNVELNSINAKEKSLPPTFEEETFCNPYKDKYFIKDNLNLFK